MRAHARAADARRCAPCGARPRSNGDPTQIHWRQPRGGLLDEVGEALARRRVAPSRAPRRPSRRAVARRRAARGARRRAAAASHSSSATTTAAPRASSVRALRVWWSLGAPGSGTSTDGTPDRRELGDRAGPGTAHRERSSARRAGPCGPRTAPACTARRSSGGAGSRARRRCALVEVARPAHVVDRDVVAVAPAVGEPEAGRVERARTRAIRRRPRAAAASSAARAEVGELGPDRVAGERARRRAACRGARPRRARRAAPTIRLARPGAASCSCTTVGDPREPGRDHARERRVAAEADDDTRPVAPHEPRRARTRRAPCPTTTPTFCEREPALQPAADGQQVDREARVGDHAALEAAVAADEAHRLAGWPRATSSAASASAGIRVTAGTARPSSANTGGPSPVFARHVGGAAPRCVAAAGDVDEDAGRDHRGSRATSHRPTGTAAGCRTPAAADDRADVDARPAPTTHAVTPAASSVPNRSGARSATRSPTTREDRRTAR